MNWWMVLYKQLIQFRSFQTTKKKNSLLMITELYDNNFIISFLFFCSFQQFNYHPRRIFNKNIVFYDFINIFSVTILILINCWKFAVETIYYITMRKKSWSIHIFCKNINNGNHSSNIVDADDERKNIFFFALYKVMNINRMWTRKRIECQKSFQKLLKILSCANYEYIENIFVVRQEWWN